MSVQTCGLSLSGVRISRNSLKCGTSGNAYGHSDDHQGDSAIQTYKITGIAGDSVVSVASGAEHHARVDDVGRAGPTAQLTSGPRHCSVQWMQHGSVVSGPEETGEPSLSAASPPCLGQCTRRNDDGPFMRTSPSQQGSDVLITAVDRDERTGVQGQSPDRGPAPSHASLRCGDSSSPSWVSIRANAAAEGGPSSASTWSSHSSSVIDCR